MVVDVKSITLHTTKHIVNRFDDTSASSGENASRGAEALLFTGDYIRALTAEQLAAIGSFARRMFDVEMHPLHNVEQELGAMALIVANPEEEPEPVLMTRADLIAYALANGYSKNMANQTWQMLRSYDARQYVVPPADDAPYLRFIKSPGSRAAKVELHSVYTRLRSGHPRARLGPPASKSFMAHVVNDVLQPAEPLVIEE